LLCHLLDMHGDVSEHIDRFAGIQWVLDEFANCGVQRFAGVVKPGMA
jgi:hypothetical protein